MDKIDDFYRLLEPKIEDAQNQAIASFIRERIGIISMAAAKGRLQSGGTLSSVSELLKNQIEIQGRTIVRLLGETLSGFDLGIYNNFINEISSYCSQKFSSQRDALVQGMLAAPPYKQNGFIKEAQLKGITEEQLTDIEAFFNQKNNLLSAELELCIRKITMSGNNTNIAPTINITGNFEVLQVGTNNTMVINETHKTSILNSFKEIREKAASIPPEKFQEIEPLIIDCEMELQKPTPNKTKIGAFLWAIGGSISTVANLGGAYQTIKMLSPVFGGPTLP
jgi:hypothetical protein